MIYQSLTFWTLIAGLAAFVARFFFPAFPLDETQILAFILFALGLIGVVPQLRTRGALTSDIVHSLAFWQLIAGLVTFVLHFYAPNFPFDQVALLGVILFVLGLFGVVPELCVRGLKK